MTVYPNPLRGRFNIDLGRTYSSTTLTIMDLHGRVVSVADYQNTRIIRSGIDGPSGVYFAEVIPTDGKRTILKLVTY